MFNLIVPGQGFQELLNAGSDGVELVEVIAENLDGQVGTDALQHLVETHRDRLGGNGGGVGEFRLNVLTDEIHQLILGSRTTVDLAPGLSRRVAQVEIGFVGGHGIGGYFRGSNPRKNMGHLGESGPYAFIGAQLILNRVVDVLPNGSEQGKGGRPFIEGRNELRAQPQEQSH